MSPQPKTSTPSYWNIAPENTLPQMTLAGEKRSRYSSHTAKGIMTVGDGERIAKTSFDRGAAPKNTLPQMRLAGYLSSRYCSHTADWQHSRERRNLLKYWGVFFGFFSKVPSRGSREGL